jgi:hypothetical protein
LRPPYCAFYFIFDNYHYRNGEATDWPASGSIYDTRGDHQMQVRSLASLDNVISSSRVLNLNKIYKLFRHNEEYSARPLFSNPLLNRAIIVKHRLKPSERQLFNEVRNVATKIMLPIETMELKLGAQSIFVGEKDFENRLSNLLEEKPYNIVQDIALLNIIDEIPSLDSYLLIESLNRAGLSPADCYFQNDETDNSIIQKFVSNEVSNLSKLTASSIEQYGKEKKIGDKFVAPDASSNTDVLREALKMNKVDYRQGLFFWKAILFYKWQMKRITPASSKVFREMRKINTVNNGSVEELVKIKKLSNTVAIKFANICSIADENLYMYEMAYNDFIYNGNHTGFRDFLIESPYLFKMIGESFNDVAHIVNFWTYRPIKGNSAAMILAQLTDTLHEFENMTSPKYA